MGNNQNNTVIEYWTKKGIKVSYLFWDLKGKNRFSEPPPDQQVFYMFEKCLEQIDISPYQLNIVQDFTPKYKYRFVLLHNRKIADHLREKEMQKYSRESYCLQVVESVKTVESQKKMTELQTLIKSVELNETSIKTSLANIDKFISEMSAQNEFLDVRGVERFLQLLDSATKSNIAGTKTSFASQIELLKFFTYFSQKYTKEFYNYLPQVKSYPHVILKTYHPINTQIIAYSLHLLSEFSWRVEDETTLIQILEKNRIAINLDSFFSPLIESIIQSDSIVSVYHNIKFVNDLMASALTKADKDVLEKNLFHTKYSLVLQNIKLKLETMQYTIEKTTFINVYQKIFKHSIQSENLKDEKTKIETILQQNFRQSTAIKLKDEAQNNRTDLQLLHETIIAILIKSDQSLNQNEQFEEWQQLPTYLTENDRRQFNKVIFDTLTELQKFYKLEFYLQTTEDESLELQSKKAKQLIDSRIVQHSLETYFSRIKQECQQNKCTQLLNNCLKKIQFYKPKEWEQLQKIVYEEPEQSKKVSEQLEEFKIILEDKQSKIKNLIKEVNQLKAKNQELTLNGANTSLPLTLPPPPSLESSLKPSETTNTSLAPPPIMNLPTLPPPVLPALPGFGSLNKQKLKEKRKPPKNLKNCNYTTLSFEKIKNSIFEQIDDTKVQINEDQLVQLFAKNVPQFSSPIKRTESIESIYTLSPSVKQPIRLLKADRQKNIQIVLIKLKLPKRQIKKVLYEFQGKFASQHTLEVIEKLLPSEQEEQALNAFDGNEQDLGVSQRFLKELTEVPQYASRIKTMIFSHVRDQVYFEIQSKIKSLKDAFVSLRTNNRLKFILQYCLAIGNYLNGQSVKGGAWGFKLETIQRLEEVKSEDKNMNGALYLIKQVSKQFDYPLFDKNQLEQYQLISKIPISQVKQEVDQLQKHILAIEKACSSKDPEDKVDKIVDFCQNFRQEVQKKLEQFKLGYDQLKDEYIKCAQYFCENGKLLSSDEFGKKMYQCILFISNTQKIWKVISQKNAKLSKHKSPINNVTYNPQKNRESAIDFRLSSFEVENRQDLSKTTPNIRQQNSNKQTTQKQEIRISIQKNPQNSSRQSHRISSIFEIHKPSKPLQQLTEDQRKKQLRSIQQESVNRAMQDVFRRRTIRFQNISVRFSQINGASNDVGIVSGVKVQDIPFLKQAEKTNST